MVEDSLARRRPRRSDTHTHIRRPIVSALRRIGTIVDELQPAVGRRRIYCGPDCRSAMYAAIADLADLERQLAETQVLAVTHYDPTWRARYERELDWLRLALDEARQRVPQELQRETRT